MSVFSQRTLTSRSDLSLPNSSSKITPKRFQNICRHRICQNMIDFNKKCHQNQRRPTQVGLWAADQLFSHILGRNLIKT
jgi:phosphopantothenoylcysteine synthetase/decarboxylase